MRSVKLALAAGAAALLNTTAFAADLPIAPPPAMYAPPADFGGWYLRGDIGFSNQRVKNLDIANYRDPGVSLASQNAAFDTGGIYQIGAGYAFNSWFRADVTGQYRGSTNFHGLDIVNFDGTAFGVPSGVGADTYTARKYEWVVMGNLYADLGTWYGVTPFIGAGVGASRNTIANFIDQGTYQPIVAGGTPALSSTAYANTASKWNFAWALHAGLGYKVSPGLTLELGYSYMNLGDGVTGPLTTFTGITRGNAFTFRDITSHDVKLGMRWSLDSGPVYMPQPPLIRKG